MLKQLSLVVLVSAALTACGGVDNKKNRSSAAASSMPASSAAASIEASSTPASVAASSMPASVAASSMPASIAASSTPTSVAASSMATSSSGTTYTFTSADNWAVNGGGSPNQLQVELNAATGSGINLVPIDWADNASTSYKYEARYTLPSAVNIAIGTKISFTLSIPQSYITDANAVLQINWGIAGGSYKYGGSGGGYRTLSSDGGVTAGTDFVITETVTVGNDVAGTTTIGLQLSKAPTDTSIKDKILVKNLKIEQ